MKKDHGENDSIATSEKIYDKSVTFKVNVLEEQR